MSKCQSRNRTIECSNPEIDPEMFRVDDTTDTRIECLAHAVYSEGRGRRAETIRR